MKAILQQDVPLMRYRTLRKGEAYTVTKYNTRNVYIDVNGLTVVIPRKDCKLSGKLTK